MTSPFKNIRHDDAFAVFIERLTGAIAELKHRLLLQQYGGAYPGQTDVVRGAIDSGAEALAWKLSFFPYLFLPDLMEALLAELALEPAFARSEPVFAHAA